MPKFTFTSPEGRSYDVEGPPGSTKEQAFTILQDRIATTSAGIPRDDTDPRTGAPMVASKPEPEVPTALPEKVEGGLEAGISMATALPASIAGGAAGAVKTLTGGKYGTPAGAQEGAQRAQEVSEALTYQPRAKTGQKVVGAVGDVLGAAGPLPELAGFASIPGIGQAAKGATGNVARAVAESPEGELIAKGARKVADAVKPEVPVDKAALARKAQDLGITLRPDMLSDNRFARMMGEALETVPLSGSKIEQRQMAFNRALGALVGADTKADRLTPDVFDKAMTRSGNTIGEISAKTPVPLTALREQFAEHLAQTEKFETAEVAKVVRSYVREFEDHVDENGLIPGKAFRKINSDLGQQIRRTDNGDLKHALSELQESAQDALTEQLQRFSPEDVERLAEARKQYAIGKAIEPLVAKSPNGDVSAPGLMQVVTSTKDKKSAMARNRGGDLGDLARIGQAFLKEAKSSGTAERGIAYGLLGGAYALHPAIAGGIYGLANLYNRAGPKMAEALTREPAP